MPGKQHGTGDCAVLKRNEFWSRVFTFVPTATKDDGEEIDEKAFRTAIDYQIENGRARRLHFRQHRRQRVFQR
jgi:hypothetical protein